MRSKRLSRFHLLLSLIAVAGVAWRICYVTFLVRSRLASSLDYTYWYNPVAANLSHGQWFIGLAGHRTAFHPPLFPFVLAAGYLVGITRPLGQAVLISCLDALMIVAMGLAGRIVGGELVGVAAAFLAAFSPTVWMYNTHLVEENAAMIALSLLLLAAYWFWTAPTIKRAIVLGLALGLCLLGRSEEILLLFLVVLPLTLTRKAASWKRRLALAAAATLSMSAVIAPISISNLLSFREPELLSTESGLAMIDTTCKQVWSGPLIGYVDTFCYTENPAISSPAAQRKLKAMKDESQVDYYARSIALRYYESHSSEIPAVMLARIGRFLLIYRPVQMVELNTQPSDLTDWPLPVAWAFQITNYIFYVLSVVGLWDMRRRRVSIVPVAGIFIENLLIAAIYAGYTRFAMAFEVALCLSASAGAAAIIREPALLSLPRLAALLFGPPRAPLVRRVLACSRSAVLAAVIGAITLASTGAPFPSAPRLRLVYEAEVNRRLSSALSVTELPDGTRQVQGDSQDAALVALGDSPGISSLDLLAPDGSVLTSTQLPAPGLSVAPLGAHQLVLLPARGGFSTLLYSLPSKGQPVERTFKEASADLVLSTNASENLALVAKREGAQVLILDPQTGELVARAKLPYSHPVAGMLEPNLVWQVLTADGHLVGGRGDRPSWVKKIKLPKNFLVRSALFNDTGPSLLLICSSRTCEVRGQSGLSLVVSSRSSELVSVPGSSYVYVFIGAGPKAYLATFGQAG